LSIKSTEIHYSVILCFLLHLIILSVIVLIAKSGQFNYTAKLKDSQTIGF